MSMRAICSSFDKDMSLEKGSGLSIFKHLIINKVVEIDITKKVNVNEVIPIIRVSDKAISNLEVI
jgi:hypothetical protein